MLECGPCNPYLHLAYISGTKTAPQKQLPFCTVLCAVLQMKFKASKISGVIKIMNSSKTVAVEIKKCIQATRHEKAAESYLEAMCPHGGVGSVCDG